MMATLSSFLASTILLKGSLVIGLAGLAHLCLKRCTATTRHRVWTSAMLALPLLFIAPLLAPTWNVDLPFERLAKPRAAMAPGGENRVSPGTRPTSSRSLDAVRPPGVAAPAAPAGSAGTAEATLQQSPSSTRAVLPWIHGFWMAGVVFLLGRLLAEIVFVRRIIASGRPATAAWKSTLRHCARSLGHEGSVQAVLSPRIGIPMVCGLNGPIVLLPLDASRWPAELRRQVGLHELAHFRALDHLTTPLARLSCALFWPNPLVRLGLRRFLAEREKACDETVVSAGVDRISYAESLLSLARTATLQARGGTTPALGHRSDFGGRIRTLLRGGTTGPIPGSKGALMVAALALLIALPLSLMVARDEVPDERGKNQDLNAALTLLSQRDDITRKRALWSLGEMEDIGAVGALIEVLHDDNPEIRALAAWALGEIKDPDSLEALVSALGDPDLRAREMAVMAVGELEDPSSIPVLGDVLRDGNEQIRMAAIWALGEIATPRSTATIIAALEDGSSLVRRAAIRALVQAGAGASGGARIHRLLEDPEWTVRRAAALALGSLGASPAVGPLTERLTDESGEVRIAAARALGRIGNVEAVESLIHALADDSAEVRAEVISALDEINIPGRS